MGSTLPFGVVADAVTDDGAARRDEHAEARKARRLAFDEARKTEDEAREARRLKFDGTKGRRNTLARRDLKSAIVGFENTLLDIRLDAEHKHLIEQTSFVADMIKYVSS